MSSSQEEVVGTAIVPLSIGTRARAFYELSKPNLSFLVVVTGVLGSYLASSGLGSIDAFRVLHLMIGMMLTASGACAVNMYVERDLDVLMRRTRNRPIPSGKVTAKEALIFAVATFTIGFVELFIFTGWIPALLSLFTLLVYVFVYTPMKRRGPIAIAIGAIPGAVPPVMGWAAVRGDIGAGGIALFAILFLWQFPHFLALAFMYRDDYARAGFRFLPQKHIGFTIAFGSVLVVLASLAPYLMGLAGLVYLIGAVMIGVGFIIPCVRAWLDLTAARARGAFIASVTWLPALLALMLLDRVIQS